MSRLEDLKPDATIRGVIPGALATVVNVKFCGSEAVELFFKTPEGKVDSALLYRHDEARIEVVEEGRPWSFDGDGGLFRLTSEALRIRLAHLFDPLLAVHTSQVMPLPHQITAVYEAMLPTQPLRFLLADDPGAGKTIMAGLLIKELIARGDVQRCLIVCPGSLVEQWQDELRKRFNLPFDILTSDKLESAGSGNFFLEHNLVIARLDKLSRDEGVQAKLQVPECRWDLVICDEAHKMSATVFGGETKYTKRYRLGQLLSTLTRHFLLMTATPHNGKEEDFQLFMALIDPDRFEGRYRPGAHQHIDLSGLMRRMVKESLLKFDSRPLFPERVAETVPYRLSPEENHLYEAVTDYVREEWSRATELQNDKRAGTVGFALTVLQRRLASSPEAIYQSLRRRRERLQERLRELETSQRSGHDLPQLLSLVLDAEEVEDLEDAPDHEVELAEGQVLDQATAARSIFELGAEIETLKQLETLALGVRRSGADTKWRELSGLLDTIFMTATKADFVAEAATPYRWQEVPPPKPSPHQKLVIFTEHRDTLTYLESRIAAQLGGKEGVVLIHGGMGRDERAKAQDLFRNDPEIKVLIATDAAGEGINLQRAHLMVNYDLPWNPNRIEQRFGRIHRIGQTEICYLWNLVASETREGDVYRRLLDKLNEARNRLQGQVFDVLGKLQFEGQSLRELLIRAIRYGDQPEVKAKLTTAIDDALDHEHLRKLLDERALAQDSMDARRVWRIREDMERAEARRLQPHFVESFFREAFEQVGGTMRQREPHRYEVTHVPALLRHRVRAGFGGQVSPRYQRIVFDKEEATPQGQIPADFVCPGHPLLDSVIEVFLERHRDLLRRGAVLVDGRDFGTEPRVLFYLEHSIQDSSLTRSGERRVVSKRILFVEQGSDGSRRNVNYAPYLDYRPLQEGEPSADEILSRAECGWIDRNLERQVLSYAVDRVVPLHVEEVRGPRLELIAKTEAAVRERLLKEIAHWDSRSQKLKLDEQAGKVNARLNSDEARKRADALEARLNKRLEELALERQISPQPPHALGGVLVVPIGLIAKMSGHPLAVAQVDRLLVAAKARAIVMEIERGLGFEPTDREFDRVGYDIESRVPGTGKLRFVEVKGRRADAETVTVTKNEILYSLNKPDDYILAVVRFGADGSHHVAYIRKPFEREPDFRAASVNYVMAELLALAQEPS